jgi:hypothetical protein
MVAAQQEQQDQMMLREQEGEGQCVIRQQQQAAVAWGQQEALDLKGPGSPLPTWLLLASFPLAVGSSGNFMTCLP